MVKEYMKHLAAAIVTENQIVTYRLLSRELKVHHNVAKRMLFEFHRQQNAKKPGSIHATYLVTGIQALTVETKDNSNGDGDIPMPSSPYMSSPAVRQSQVEEESVKRKVLTLVKEENLEGAKAKYESISSIHMYSLEPSTFLNLEALSAITQKIMTDYISEDPLIHNKTYGVIQNPHVKRRTGARPPAALPVKQETKTAFAKSKDSKTSNETKTLFKAKEAQPGSSEQATKVAAPGLLKRESSDLLKSFAKTKPRAKPAAASAKAETSDDVPMKDVSSDDEGDEVNNPLAEDKPESEAHRKSRLEQAEKLRKLAEGSDDDDEAMPDVGANAKDKEIKPESDAEADSDIAKEEEEEDDEEGEAVKQEEPEPEPEPIVTVSNGRRRGRRKVMKKKTTRDAEGFLVTKEEAVWESFSEDDVSPPSKAKNVSSSAVAKGGKKATGGAGGGKPGQGNIMNFFGKK